MMLSQQSAKRFQPEQWKSCMLGLFYLYIYVDEDVLSIEIGCYNSTAGPAASLESLSDQNNEDNCWRATRQHDYEV